MEKKKIKMNKIVLNLLAAVLLVVLLVGASWWFFAAITDHGKELSVPDLSFMTVEDAGKVLRHEKLNITDYSIGVRVLDGCGKEDVYLNVYGDADVIPYVLQ